MSVSQDLLRALLRVIPTPGSTSEDPEVQRRLVPAERHETPPPRFVYRFANVVPLDVGGRRVLRLIPRRGATGHRVIYWHGGSWEMPVNFLHWPFLTELLRRSGAEIWVPSYPLAPEHTIEDTLPLIEAVHSAAAASLDGGADGSGASGAGVGPGASGGRLVVAGDSAGGNIALAHGLLAERHGWRPIDQILAYSPAADALIGGPEVDAAQKLDPLLVLAACRVAAGFWAGERELTDPLVSPQYAPPAELAALPPTAIFQGDRDILWPSARDFAFTAGDAGAPIEWVPSLGGFHDYMFALFTPEARACLTRSAELVTGTGA